MKRREWLFRVLSSYGAGAALAEAARPRYGGILRFFPALPPIDKEPLSRLAASVTVDADRKTWRIGLRPYVIQHDNNPLNATVAADALRAAAPAWTVNILHNWSLTVVADRPLASLFAAADPQFKCGPFEKVDGAKPSLRAFDLYWDRRPFVDAIEAVPNAQDADIAELALAGARRPRTDTHRLWSTSPVETVIVDASKAPAGLREALSVAIDRQSIVKVMFQGRGEVAGGLQPQWASGYSFLFPVQQDLIRAKALLAGLAAKPAGPLVLGYPSADTLVRQVADRIAVNARDAGLLLQVKPGPGDLTIARESGQPAFGSYESERAWIEERKLVPVVHVPRLYAIHSRVRGWEAAHDGKSVEIHPESIWLDS